MSEISATLVQPSSSGTGSSSSSTSKFNKNADRLKKLRELHAKRNEACKLNHHEVVEENKRQQLPANWAKKQEWAKRKLEQVEEREKAESENLDFELEKLRDVQADDAERWERRKSSKKNPDNGFSNFENAAARKYERLVKQIKPNFEQYERMKEETPQEQFYASKNAIFNGRKDTKEDIDRLVDDMENDYNKQSRYSRRRTFDDDADIDYINERNLQFNKKVERFYGKYTSEIKQNLERGTAV